jgi:glycosyltransferase involved in cell wall biosynthesis
LSRLLNLAPAKNEPTYEELHQELSELFEGINLSQQKGPRVTVLVDTYNSADFIEEAIDSVLAQEFPPEQLEIIVVDDGSADDTAHRVKKYGDRVQYFYKSNGGHASALNFGISRAAGEIVAFLDGDDYWLPGKLKSVAFEFEKNPETGMVYHNFVYKQEPSQALRPADGLTGFSGFLADDRNSLLNYDLYPTATLAFRRSVLQRLLPIPDSLVVQADAHLSACVVFIAPIKYIDKPLTVYRVHAGNLWNWGGNTPSDYNILRRDPTARGRMMRRVATTREIGVGVGHWLERNGFDINSPDVRTFLMQWTLSSDAAEFALAPPGRLRFFRHLLDQSRYGETRMTWRHQFVHYANAFGSLFLGYRNFYRLDAARIAIKRSLRSVLGRS